jgi:hypothetical protein
MLRTGYRNVCYVGSCLPSFLRVLGLCYFGVLPAYDRHWTASGRK